MTEASPPPSEQSEKQLRDAALWVQRIERLEVSDVPEGTANVNVQGRREVGALQGFDLPGLLLMITLVQVAVRTHWASSSLGVRSSDCAEDPDDVIGRG